MKPKNLYQNQIAVHKSKTHGFGVFAEKKIRKGEKIEECYFLLSKGGDKVLDDFYFEAEGKFKYALLTGYGIIYNHDDEPNADYNFNYKKRIVTIDAVRTIQKGEEIFVTYGDDWFSSRNLKAKKVKTKR